MHTNALLDLNTLEPIDCNLAIMDVQADFQISKAYNKACLVTHRQMKKAQPYSLLYFWGNAQTKPYLKISVNFFTHSNTRLINVRAKFAKLIVNLDGAAFSRLYPLANLIYNILMQGQHVFFTSGSPTIDEIREDGDFCEKTRSSIVTKFNISIRECEIDLFLEKVPELISSLSNDYVAKIISMLFSDICYFPIKIKEFSSDAVAFHLI
jgi:hypothetical protein